jgi:uncharacterized cupredoxin-like copper-binding protein
LPDATTLLEPLAKDPEAIVRLEVLAFASTASPYDPAATGLVHKVLGMPLEAGLERLAKETLQKLEPDPARMLVPGEAKALRFVLARLSPAELAKAPAVEPVWMAQVDREGIVEAVRESALQSLAKIHQSGRAVEITQAIGRVESSGAQGVSLAQKMAQLLVQAPRGEIRAAESAIEKLASATKLPKVRAAAYAAWARAVDDPDALWKRLEKTQEKQLELLAALPLVRDAGVRAGIRPALERVLRDQVGAEALRLAALRALPLTGESFGPRNFDLLALLIKRGDMVPEVAQAVLQLPEKAMGGEKGGELGALAPVVADLGRWLERVPEKERRSPGYAAVLQLGRVLAGKLEAQAAATNRKLREVKAEVCFIRTVFEQARFELQSLPVRAGQPLELVFENADGAARNLVLVAPGVREQVLAEAAKLPPNQPDAEGRFFVPKHPGILAATKLLATGERQVLTIKVPEKPGKYEFVCTAPGSPEGMRGVLEVVER